MHEWTFLTNHALVLSLLAKRRRTTGQELATAIGITERVVRRIITELDAAGYISKKKDGRRLRYRINPDLPLRNDSHHKVAVGDFLEALGWKGRRKCQSAKVISQGGSG